MSQINVKKSLPLALLLALLTGLILCPLVTVFAEAVIVDGRLDLYQAWGTIASAENVRTIYNSLLLGICVVLCSTVIAVPTAFILARTQLAKHGWLDIVFMIPFMTPPYIASMGWILFMQKRYAEARVYIDQAVKNDADSSAVILEHAGDIHAMAGDAGEAVRLWRLAAAKDPGNKLLARKIRLGKYVEK